MTTHSIERDTDGMVPQWISRRAVDFPFATPEDEQRARDHARALGGDLSAEDLRYTPRALRPRTHPSADTPDESQLGEHPDLNDRMEAGFAKLREAAANSLVRMDAAEAAADALSKWAHLLPTYATEAREAAASWRLARSL